MTTSPSPAHHDRSNEDPVHEDSDLAAVFAPEALFSPAEALAAAERCLQCYDAPCQAHCPASIPIPRFIRMVQSSNIRGAAEAIRSANPMAHSCGLACPQDQYCAAACTRAKLDGAVEIRRLHRYATTVDRRGRPLAPRAGHATKPDLSSPHVAVVGAGPAGLACAFELAHHGVAVTVLEARRRPGGVLAHSIPLYRFPAGAIQDDVSFVLGRSGGRPRTASAAASPPAGGRIRVLAAQPIEDWRELESRYDAVFLAPGAVARSLDWGGCHLHGISSAITFLERCRARRYQVKVGARVAIVGGGNVAVDAALAAVRCGQEWALRRDAGLGTTDSPFPDVHLFYRRSRPQMPAWDREVHEAERAGVHLHMLTQPVEFIGRRGRVRSIRFQRIRLGPADRSGRPSPVPIPGSDFQLPFDQVLLATGMELEGGDTRLPRTRSGWLETRPATGQVKGIFYAGGDATGSDQSIVSAVGDGKRAARAILRRLERGHHEA